MSLPSKSMLKRSRLVGSKVRWPTRNAEAGPAAIPRAAYDTKLAEAAVRSALLKTSAIYRRLIDRALPNPTKNRPSITI